MAREQTNCRHRSGVKDNEFISSIMFYGLAVSTHSGPDCSLLAGINFREDITGVLKLPIHSGKNSEDWL